jgi:DNA-binding transcriptional MocR family regulator
MPLTSPQPLYALIGQTIARLIDDQVFKPGERLPSVREVAAQNGVSISTAVQAMRWLEELHLVSAKPRAGYFVSPRRRGMAIPSVSRPPKHSMVIERQSRCELLRAFTEEVSVVSFGAYAPEDKGLFAHERIRIALARATRVHRQTLVEYDESCGTQALREAVARRTLHLGCHLQPENIIITASCTHAVGLCLQAATRPGDTVALESPTHFGFLDLLEALGLRVLEIPTHPTRGMSLPALQLAIDTQPVKAVLSVPTLSNPLGAVMRHADKQALVHMLAARQIPLIEDVVFNDLLASDRRRKAAKAFDGDGWVMICGSFCKTVAPGLRMGYVEAGRWKDTVSRLKRVQGVPTIKVLEYALAELLTQSAYEARLRRLSAMAKTRLDQARALIFNNFPKGTRVSAPQGGYTLWVELPPELDSMALFRTCKAEGIIFGPGPLFSASNHFDHCIRLSFAGPWTDVQQRALARIGSLARAQRDTDKVTKV